MTVKIGTSGWQYPGWRATFYPKDLPTSRRLGFYTQHFDTVELNNAFYGLPAAEVFERWRTATPEGFEMAVNVSSYLTHNKRLRDPRQPVDRFMERAGRLGPKLGPVLLQLPPTMRVETGRLDETLACFSAGVRVAVEARHESWDCDEVWEVLARHGAAWCIADAPWRRWPVVRTADWGYLRFHEGVASPRPCDGRRALATWAGRVAETWEARADVYAFFNNDTCACAPNDARRFAGGLPTPEDRDDEGAGARDGVVAPGTPSRGAPAQCGPASCGSRCAARKRALASNASFGRSPCPPG